MSSVNVECHKIHLVVFEIEPIFPNIGVQCIALYKANDESLWQLSQKHIVLIVIHVAGGYVSTFTSTRLTGIYSWSFPMLSRDPF